MEIGACPGGAAGDQVEIRDGLGCTVTENGLAGEIHAFPGGTGAEFWNFSGGGVPKIKAWQHGCAAEIRVCKGGLA